MIKKYITAMMAALAVFIAGLVFVAPATYADDTTDRQSEETVTNPVRVDADSKKAQRLEAQEADGDYDFELDLDFTDTGEVSAEFEHFNKSLVTAEGKRVIGPLRGDGGNRHWNTSDAKKCPILSVYPSDRKLKQLKRTFFIKKGHALKRFKHNVMSDKVVKQFPDGRQKLSVLCFRIPDGARFPDTGKDFNGNLHGFDNVVRGPPMLFEVTLRTVRDNGHVVEKLVPTRRGQDKDHDGKVDEGDCWNPKANIVKFQLAEVEYTSSYYWRGVGDTIARVHAEGEATISQGACSFTLNFDFFAQGTAGFDTIVKGRTEIVARGAAIRILDKTTVRANARANAEASVKATLRASFNDECDEGPTYSAPSVSANASACVEPGQATGIVTVTATNNNDIAVPATFMFPGKPNQTATIAANTTVSKRFTGIAPGSYSGTVRFGEPVNKSAPYSVTVEECDTPPPTDTPPQISCTWHPHVFEKGGNVYGWCETIDTDGDPMSLNVEVDEDTPYAHISGVVPSSVRWDGTPCPAGTKCWRFTIWGDSPGFARIIATVTAGGKSAVSRGTIEVKEEEF